MLAVGRYKVKDRIGEGAMAEVYLGHDPEIDRPVAIKILQSQFRDNAEITSRFLKEARAAGALSHPGIVTVYDVGEADGIPYIAMELLDGMPLSEVLVAERALSVERAVAYGRQLAEALHYAHERGIVHRDVKPSNIWISRDAASIKLLDFGIAHRAEADQLRAEVEALRTQAGQVIGTPRYMSPEQALGRPLDHRSDLFSLGAVLYEMMTGSPAFGGNGMATIALQITQQAPLALEAQINDCPKGLAYIVKRLMEKSPERRYADGAEVARALLREERALDVAEDGVRRGPSYRMRLLIAGMLVVIVVLAASFAAILDRQGQTMRRIAMTSGSSIASFVASNAALGVVENAGVDPRDQDWVPVQEFIRSAAADPNVAELRVIDGSGIVRASSKSAENGKRRQTASARDLGASSSATGDDLRFVHPIVYAGKRFGTVELTLDTTELNAAAADTRQTLLLFGLAIFAAIMTVTASISRLLVQPLRALRRALVDVTAGQLDTRISHRRRDEFGDLFDGFNDMAASLQDRMATEFAETASNPGDSEFDPDATVVCAVPMARKIA